MLKYKGGDNVKAGFYWNTGEWEAQIVSREGGVLTGGTEAHYLRLPILAVLVLAPIMGGVYAFFLPFIGFAMVLAYLAGRLRRLFTTMPPAAAKTLSTPQRAGRERHVDVDKAAEADLRKAA